MNDLTITGLKKIYKTGNGIVDVNINVKKGEIHALLGENGAGKSTSIKCIMGMEKYDSGKIEILGEEIKYGNNSIRDKIGYSPELPELPKQFSGKECMEIYGNMRGLTRNNIKNEIKEFSELLDLKNFLDKKVNSYSRGMLAKLDFAIAMLGNPELLILDEPSAGLDPVSANRFMEILKEISKTKRTVLLSSHQLADVEKICSGATIIHNGRTILEGDINEIIKKNNSNKTFKVEFTNLNEDLLDNVKKVAGVSIISKNDIGNSLILHTDSTIDIRLDIAKAAINAKSIMLSFSEEKNSLENVFINLINGDNKNDNHH